MPRTPSVSLVPLFALEELGVEFREFVGRIICYLHLAGRYSISTFTTQVVPLTT